MIHILGKILISHNIYLIRVLHDFYQQGTNLYFKKLNKINVQLIINIILNIILIILTYHKESGVEYFL